VFGKENQTKRNRGCIIIVSLNYRNQGFLIGQTLRTSYQYRATHVPDTDYKVIQVIPGGNDQSRILRKRFGIHLKFMQTGKIGRFSGRIVLLEFVSGLGLLAIATTLVDRIAMYLGPRKQHFTSHKYKVIQYPHQKKD